MPPTNELKNPLIDLAVRLIKRVSQSPKIQPDRHLADHRRRSAMLPTPHCARASTAESSPDAGYRRTRCLKDRNETRMWSDFNRKSDPPPPFRLDHITRRYLEVTDLVGAVSPLVGHRSLAQSLAP